jgi:hypothetical protein
MGSVRRKGFRNITVNRKDYLYKTSFSAHKLIVYDPVDDGRWEIDLDKYIVREFIGQDWGKPQIAMIINLECL